YLIYIFFFQAEDGIRDRNVTGVQTCALPIFDGKIDIQNRENVSDGEPILQLVADEPQIKATVTEFDLGKIKEGDKVDVKVTSTGKKGKGEIKKISELPKSYEESLSKSG